MVTKLVGALALGSFLGCAGLSRLLTPETPGGPTPAEAALKGVETAVTAITAAFRSVPAPVIPQAPPPPAPSPMPGPVESALGTGLVAAALGAWQKGRANAATIAALKEDHGVLRDALAPVPAVNGAGKTTP